MYTYIHFATASGPLLRHTQHSVSTLFRSDGTVELHLPGLIGTESHPDMQKIPISMLLLLLLLLLLVFVYLYQQIHTNTYTYTHTYIYVYINIKLYYKRSYIFRLFRTICREICYCVCRRNKTLKLLKMHKTLDRCMIKSALLTKCGSGWICNSKFLFWCVWCAGVSGVSGVLVGSELNMQERL